MATTNRDRKEKYNRLHPEKVKEWYQNNKDRVKEYQLKRSFGITIKVFKALNEVQNGKCAICGKLPNQVRKTSKYLAVDHDHKTGKIRGLLCNSCNVALGLLEDSIEILEKSINYLRNHA